SGPTGAPLPRVGNPSQSHCHRAIPPKSRGRQAPCSSQRMEPRATPASIYGRIADIWRQLPWLFRLAVLSAVLSPIVLCFAWFRCGITGCPDVGRLRSYRPGGAPVLLDRQDRVVGDLAPVEGELVSLHSLPRHVPDAFIAVEDRRFREHGAVDLTRVLGALW